MTEGDTKVCKMCRMEIPGAARKCPYCQHLQDWLSVFVYHPLFTTSYAMLVMGAAAGLVAGLMYIGWANVYREGESFTPYAGQIAVTESRITFGESDGVPTVTVIGMVRNSSPVTWKEVAFDVDFFDEQGVLIDTGQELDYSYRLPAGGEAGFKVTFRRERPETDYSSHTVRVIWAKDQRSAF